MDFLDRMKGLAIALMILALLPPLQGCRHKASDEAIDALKPIVRRFSTTEEAMQFAKQWPAMELLPREATADDDVGGVTFKRDSRLTIEQAVVLSKFDKLTFIVAEYCDIEPGFFDHLSDSNVSLLLLGNSNVNDRSVAAIASLPKIRAIVIQNTEVSKEGVNELRKSIAFENVITLPI